MLTPTDTGAEEHRLDPEPGEQENHSKRDAVIRDWVLLLRALKAIDVRLYCLILAEARERKRRVPMVTTTDDELCWLLTASDDTPVSLRTVKRSLGRLAEIGLVTSSRGKDGQRRLRAHDRPPESFDGWRSAHQMMSAYRADWRKNRPRPSGDAYTDADWSAGRKGWSWTSLPAWVLLNDALTSVDVWLYAICRSQCIDARGSSFVLRRTNDELCWTLPGENGKDSSQTRVTDSLRRQRQAGVLVDAEPTKYGCRQLRVVHDVPEGYTGWVSVVQKLDAYRAGWQTQPIEERLTAADVPVLGRTKSGSPVDNSPSQEGQEDRIRNPDGQNPEADRTKSGRAPGSDQGFSRLEQQGIYGGTTPYPTTGGNPPPARTREADGRTDGIPNEENPGAGGEPTVAEELVAADDLQADLARVDLRAGQRRKLVRAVDQALLRFPVEQVETYLHRKAREARTATWLIRAFAEFADDIKRLPRPRQQSIWPIPVPDLEDVLAVDQPEPEREPVDERPALRLATPVHEPSRDHTRLDVWADVDPRFRPRSVREREVS